MEHLEEKLIKKLNQTISTPICFRSLPAVKNTAVQTRTTIGKCSEDNAIHDTDIFIMYAWTNFTKIDNSTEKIWVSCVHKSMCLSRRMVEAQ